MVYNTSDTNRREFKNFSMTQMELTDREATALTVSTVNLTSGMSIDQIIMVSYNSSKQFYNSSKNLKFIVTIFNCFLQHLYL